jgi:hypothetical protein
MIRRKVIISYAHLAIDMLIELVRFVITKLTGNPNFTTPDPTIAELKDMADALEAKNIAAQEGGRQARSERKDARKKMLDGLRSLALYVEKIADGNETIMVSSGLYLSKEPQPAQKDDFWVIRGPNSGDILAGCVRYPKARTYVWLRYTGANPPDDKRQWTLAGVSTQTRIGLTDLDSGSKEWLCYCAVTSAGMMAWSEPISIIIG